MNPERWRQIRQVYSSALGHPPGQRDAFLHQACAGDQSLRKEVASLLAQEGRSEGPFDSPALDAAAKALARDEAQEPAPDLTGQTLSHYRILEKIGEGGMGVVYRAEDTRLKRSVALKLLPPRRLSDPERKRRFVKEARAASALNHPNIVTIHDIDQADGLDFIAMEYVAGKTLDRKIPRKGMALDKALGLGIQIADALAAAHAAGIIHRDLKPSNIKVSDAGQVKILDFGLAKLTERETSEVDGMSALPATDDGMILGTVTYMSPEQAQGKKVDARSDIFSFGAVLYEMISGRRAFECESVAETMAAIIRDEPKPLGQVRNDVPDELARIIHRCLRKDPDRRFQSMSDVRVELQEVQEALESHPEAGQPPGRARNLRWIVPVILIIVALALVTTWWLPRPVPEPPEALRLRRAVLSLPESAPLALAKFAPLGIGRPSLALSPDGTRLVYVAVQGSSTQLYLRPLDRLDPEPIPGTEGAYSPFFSPDGQWLGFFAGDKLKKVSLGGGQPVPLCDARNPYGAAWSSDGIVYFADSEGRRLARVPADGGSSETVPLGGNPLVFWPEFLPGQATIAAGFGTLAGDGAFISLSDGRLTRLPQFGAHPRYAASGHMIFTREGSVAAVPFDLSAMRTTGNLAILPEQIRTEIYGAGQYSFSRDGTLAYVSGNSSNSGVLVWVDRNGNEVPLDTPPQRFGSFHISPDGRRAAIELSGVGPDIWLLETARPGLTRVTTCQTARYPVWSPDSRSITYTLRDGNRYKIVSVPVDKSEEPKLMYQSEESIVSQCWSPDGGSLAFSVRANSGDLHVLHIGTGKTRPLENSRFHEWGAVFSRNGKWIAFTSDESGRYEVYVRPFPGPGARVQVSAGGGEEPVWGPADKEIVYRSGTVWMSVPIALEPEFQRDPPRRLFEGGYLNVPGPSFDISPDGSRFLLIRPIETQTSVTEIQIVFNWFEELKRLCPAGKVK